ncbi:sigma-70 family RNA polymerase sigma factor [Actinoplanes sp. NPDC049316]|uniref:sigma-70 family RNA polymerase sigma factor n=1 Tax=Actinoplanes sp. NPDC049316 TaxID=3154727 RepID=UPI00343F5D3A
MSSLAVPVATDAVAGDRATVEAIRSMREAGCHAADRRRLRESVIRRELPLARHLARGYADRGEPVEDLMQVAALALVKAVDGFDPDRGTSFVGYAYPTILGELKRHFRDRSWSVHMPRQMQERCLEVTRTRAELVQRLHRAPTTAEIAGVLGMPESDVRAAAAGTSAYRADSLNRPVGSADDPCERQDLLGGPDRNFDILYDRVTLQPALEELPERARYAVRRYFFDNRTQDEIAAELNTSQMSVSRLLAQALAHLRSCLEPSAPARKENGDGVRIYTYEARQRCLVATVSAPDAVAPLGELRDALVQILVNRRPRTLVVDMRRLPQASPAIARALLDTYRAAGHTGARVCVVNVAADLLALLRRTGVARLLPCRGVPPVPGAAVSGTPARGVPQGSVPAAVPPRHRVEAPRQRPAAPALSCRGRAARRRPRRRAADHALRATSGQRREPVRSSRVPVAPVGEAAGRAQPAQHRSPHPTTPARPVSGRSRPPPSRTRTAARRRSPGRPRTVGEPVAEPAGFSLACRPRTVWRTAVGRSWFH